MAGGQKINSSTILPFLNPAMEITEVTITMARVMLLNMKNINRFKDIL
jgi:hypothetical protein